MTDDEIRSHDMYGHRIVPLEETGYGVSTAFAKPSPEVVPYDGPTYPVFTVFHVSDGFRQSLFSVMIDEPDHPSLVNIFHERIAALMAAQPAHGLGVAKSLPVGKPQRVVRGVIPPCCWKAMLWPWHRCQPRKESDES